MHLVDSIVQYNKFSFFKKKIAQVKEAITCHRNERIEIKKKQRQRILNNLERRYDIKPHNIENELLSTYLCNKKIRRFQTENKHQRRISIIKKILLEYKRQKEIDHEMNKSYDYTVRPKEKIISGLEVIGTRIQLVSKTMLLFV